MCRLEPGRVCGTRESYAAGGPQRYFSWDMLFPQGLQEPTWPPLGFPRSVPSPPPPYSQKAAWLRLGRYPEGAQRANGQSTYSQGGPIMENEVSWLLIRFPDLHQFTFSSRVIYMKIRQPPSIPLKSDEAAWPVGWCRKMLPHFPNPGQINLSAKTRAGLVIMATQHSRTFPKLDR